MWAPLSQAASLADDGGLSEFLKGLDAAVVSKAATA
jgi:hypothetical protein